MRTFSGNLPDRIICLTEETTETLYLLGAEQKIVGISSHCNRPPVARKEKPRVSTFITAQYEKILDLKPDLVLGFSDLQADIAARLIREGITVMVFNHRDIQGIFNMITTLGSLVGKQNEAQSWLESRRKRIEEIQTAADGFFRRPNVYFEEWNDPIITGIGWVSEIITLAGGEECFPEHAGKPLAKQRIVSDPSEVIQKGPDIMLASWCGKKFQKNNVLSREGWNDIPAVQHDEIHEIPSDIILQPGPAAITDGIESIHGIIKNWTAENG